MKHVKREAKCKYYTVINNLGQVVLPAEVLALLGIDRLSRLVMYIEDNAIVLRRVGASASGRVSRGFEPAAEHTNHTVEGTGAGGCPAWQPKAVVAVPRRENTQERLTPCRTKSSSAARGCTT
ncbi:AbrB/MazE/SpoVT family DNA-binding domain-containing protein [Desulfurispora thermophila]|uniref:AbrB/MazE/SpoVT family DNA-binding domain-containing protein n=1 Tax=Desulfurispora thermophila TaxID=265470 RepID=UPI00037C1E57|nr:AbrB/MazE/SpoVT family DNA-binding domain-containing protein [Desulfurispora thermophila]